MLTGRDLLLDTNVLVYLARGRDVGQAIAKSLNLDSLTTRPLVCRVTHGEILVLAKSWSESTTSVLEAQLRRLVTVEIDSDAVLRAYADIIYYVTKELKPAKPNCENDIWIAAAAKAANATLVTTDKWFSNIVGVKVSCIQVDSRTGLITSTAELPNER